MSGVVLAHGVGERADLPLPLGLAVAGAGLAVLVSFVALLLLWRTPRLGAPDAGRPFPAGLQRVLDAPALRWTLRLVALALSLVVLAVAFAGPTEVQRNLAPYALYVTFWVGLVPLSLLLGPVWRVVNPLRAVHALLERAAGPAPYADRLDRIGMWPAVISLSAFVWLELVAPGRADPVRVGLFVVLYAVVHLFASLFFGAGWFARGDAFEVWSTLLGRLAPFGRGGDGRLRLRNPLDGAASTPAVRGLAAVVVVLVGSTAYDGLSRTRWWQEGPGSAGEEAVLPGTLGLFLLIAAVGVLYAAASAASARMAGSTAAEHAAVFAHALIPVGAGYAIAHYFSLLVLDGQATWILASNPFGRDDVDLFGSYGNTVDYDLLTVDAIALVQVAAIVSGHVLGVVLAHDRALEALPARHQSAGQLPLLLVMIGLTVGGLALLLGA